MSETPSVDRGSVDGAALACVTIVLLLAGICIRSAPVAAQYTSASGASAGSEDGYPPIPSI
ncbi:MAG TPA: hypothetical protein VHR41_21060, partial [Gemmatimonadales bacterium]|nr:hypothetical protein [Gemmatimonadales bacterium]